MYIGLYIKLILKNSVVRSWRSVFFGSAYFRKIYPLPKFCGNVQYSYLVFIDYVIQVIEGKETIHAY